MVVQTNWDTGKEGSTNQWFPGGSVKFQGGNGKSTTVLPKKVDLVVCFCLSHFDHVGNAGQLIGGGGDR